MDINKKLEDILSGMDAGKIKKSKQTINEFLNTPDGEKLKKQLNSIDKQKLLNVFSNMGTNEIKKKLSNLDSDSLSKMKADEIIQKLKKL
ncbi:MAG: hypothetical protein N2171_06505 [Clostridia bacterium]|nr:hypothetical protein [Clostridia bacterium]